MQQIPGFDGLRAVAALLVFGVHYNQLVGLRGQLGPLATDRLLANGEIGLSLFFLLSGCLLSQPYWRSMQSATPWPAYRRYLARRALRILPAYYLCLALLIWLTGHWRVPLAGTDTLLHLVFLFNFAEFSVFSLNPAFWSLAVEVQFYLLLPLLMAGLARLPGSGRLPALLLLCALCYALQGLLTSSLDSTRYWPGTSMVWLRPHGAVLHHSLLAQMPHLLFGVALGAWFAAGRRDEAWRQADRVLVLAVMLLIALLGTTGGDALQWPHASLFWPWGTGLLAVILIFLPHSRHGLRLFESRVMRHLGRRSYAIYLFHIPALWWVDAQLRNAAFDGMVSHLALLLLALGMTLLAAEASGRWVEEPARRLYRRRVGTSRSD